MSSEPIERRYLLMWTSAYARLKPTRSIVVSEHQLASYVEIGWRLVGEDPAPWRYLDPPLEDDGA